MCVLFFCLFSLMLVPLACRIHYRYPFSRIRPFGRMCTVLCVCVYVSLSLSLSQYFCLYLGNSTFSSLISLSLLDFVFLDFTSEEFFFCSLCEVFGTHFETLHSSLFFTLVHQSFSGPCLEEPKIFFFSKTSKHSFS